MLNEAMGDGEQQFVWLTSTYHNETDRNKASIWVMGK